MPYYGIAYLDRQRSLFNPTTNLPSLEKAGSLLNQEDSYIYGMQGDSIFLVKDNNGLYAWNYLQNSFTNIDLKDKNVYKQINAVLGDKDGRIWIGTYTSGLFSYDPHSKASKKLPS